MSSIKTTRREETFHRESKRYEQQQTGTGFGEVNLQPSYDMEFVYPPGMEPISFQRQASVFSEDTEEGKTYNSIHYMRFIFLQ